MIRAKVSRLGIIIIIDTRTGRQVATINCSRYKGANSVKVVGSAIHVLCKDRRTRVFDAATGKLKRTK